jgi:hypothetical protein
MIDSQTTGDVAIRNPGTIWGIDPRDDTIHEIKHEADAQECAETVPEIIVFWADFAVPAVIMKLVIMPTTEKRRQLIDHPIPLVLRKGHYSWISNEVELEQYGVSWARWWSSDIVMLVD